jgi:heterodisulfide reductase subunit C
MRQELSIESKTEIQNRTKEIESVRKHTEIRVVKINQNIDTVSAVMDYRIAVHVSRTGKDLDRNTQEVNQRSKALIKEVNRHEVQVETAVEGTREVLRETKGGLDKSVESTSKEVRTLMFVGHRIVSITKKQSQLDPIIFLIKK